MIKIVEYKIVEEEQVNIYIAVGWEPFSSPVPVRRSENLYVEWYQAMVKYEKVKE